MLAPLCKYLFDNAQFVPIGNRTVQQNNTINNCLYFFYNYVIALKSYMVWIWLASTFLSDTSAFKLTFECTITL